MNNKEKPEPGDMIYVDTHLYMSIGVDDVEGGLATVSKVTMGVSAGNPTPFVSVDEHPGHSYNWVMLSERQEHLKKEFGDLRAHACPDHRPEFNEP